MKYDPIKRSLGKVFNATPFLRVVFYRLLDLLLLRTWYVKKELRKWARDHAGARNLLDAGSGFGQYTWFLSGLNPDWKILAVDVKEEQIADCTRFFDRTGRLNVTFEVADLTSFRMDGHFDFILSVDVMEHIRDDDQVFRNFYSSLNTGGMLLISTPSDQGGSDVHDHGEEDSFIEEHVRDGYNPDDILQKLKNAGFREADAYYSYGRPGQAAWKISMKVPIRMLNLTKGFFIIIPFYYMLAFPVAYLLNYLDLRTTHHTGTGLIVKARK